MRSVVVLFACLLIAPLQASMETNQFDSPQMEIDYNRLINELRCLVCQNQNLAGSDAALARDLRKQTYEMLHDGKSPDQVVDFMVARYGDFVLYRPQFKANTYLLWLGPLVLLLFTLVLVLRRLGKKDQLVVAPEAVDAARNLLEQKESPER